MKTSTATGKRTGPKAARRLIGVKPRASVASLPDSEAELVDDFEDDEEVELTEELSPTALLKTPTASKLIDIRSIETETVRELHEQYKDGSLDIQPPFQRRSVWDVKKKSTFIESLILDFPIPLIFLAEEKGEAPRRFVVDGQQRLRALFEYIDGGYLLKSLGEPFEGKSFAELGTYAKLLRGRHLRLITITKQSNPDVAFDLFERLNKGAKPLNQQELRNCKYHRTAYNKFLLQLSREKMFRDLRNYDVSKPHPRMHDVEDVLRFMAFLDQKYVNHPDKRTVKFLNDQMDLGAQLKPADREARLKEFRKALRLCRTVFGKKRAFRRFNPGDSEGPDGHWESRVNKALMDVELYWFTKVDSGKVTEKADSIRDAATSLMCETEFADLLSQSTSAADRVARRFELWKSMLDGVLGNDKKGRRYYSFEEKARKFERDNRCYICKQEILDVNDAHMDHVTPKNRGGATTKANAGLSHQYCNQSKGAK
jgi:hypothetical protein